MQTVARSCTQDACVINALCRDVIALSSSQAKRVRYRIVFFIIFSKVNILRMKSPQSLYNLLLVLLLVCLGAVWAHYSSRPNSDHSDKSKFHDPEVVRNKEHVKEHLEEMTGENKEDDMTDEELEFHYFKLHDFDNNTKLDGLEILAAISHVLPYEDKDGKDRSKEELQLEALVYYTDMIDQVLKDDDFNGDGYLTYLEYVLARRRSEDNIAQGQEL